VHQKLAVTDAELDAIITIHALMLRDLKGVGTDVASQLLVTVGDNPEPVTTEAKFAALVGVAPIPASSGRTTRHRLSRGGDRRAKKAIHHVALVRMRTDMRTRNYVARGRAEGKSTTEVIRCLKRCEDWGGWSGTGWQSRFWPFRPVVVTHQTLGPSGALV